MQVKKYLKVIGLECRNDILLTNLNMEPFRGPNREKKFDKKWVNLKCILVS